MAFRSPIFAAAALFTGCVSLFAQDAAVRVLASSGMKAVVQELQPKCERAIGRSLAIEFSSTSALKQKIEAGAQFDVAILTSDAIAALVEEHKLAGATSADFARSGIGVAVRAGAPEPDIRTSEAMKRTLLAAKSITYAGDGASRVNLDKMYARLGIAAEVNPKLILTEGSGPAMASVAAGQAEMVLTLMSELLPVHGIKIVGPLPPDLQSYVSFGAAASTGANNAGAARTLIASLKDPTAAPVYKAKGMEPR
jgi:molybdate transport system substrate-binding protein